MAVFFAPSEMEVGAVVKKTIGCSFSVLARNTDHVPLVESYSKPIFTFETRSRKLDRQFLKRVMSASTSRPIQFYWKPLWLGHGRGEPDGPWFAHWAIWIGNPDILFEVVAVKGAHWYAPKTKLHYYTGDPLAKKLQQFTQFDPKPFRTKLTDESLKEQAKNWVRENPIYNILLVNCQTFVKQFLAKIVEKSVAEIEAELATTGEELLWRVPDRLNEILGAQQLPPLHSLLGEHVVAKYDDMEAAFSEE